MRVYDAECPWGREDDFFLSLADETPGTYVLDLGCGSGRLALGLAAAGHTVTGVDPAAASLAAARAKPGAERVIWIEGTSPVLPDASFEVAVMTSHVAQFFVGDDDWARALADLRRALVPGRTPCVRHPRPAGQPVGAVEPGRLTPPDGRTVTAWTEVTDVRDDVVVGYAIHYAFPDGSNGPGRPDTPARRELVSTATLRFRTEETLRASLRDASFTVRHVYGVWSREPVGAQDGEFLVLAHA
ncbi:class I SAM-dependent methyltransferase [Streptomyces sp. NPDC087658]|uniref:class I SAM-dependent methyltransferase n=1 Tax=Streptomyces sp. NPDC087658 TaxID=3365800 RepID=UPI0037FBB43E